MGAAASPAATTPTSCCQRRRLPPAVHAAAAAVPGPASGSRSTSSTPVGARIRVDGYFAVTSNTAQFGAERGAVLRLRRVQRRGAHRFDALFQFSPFHFIVAISARVSLKVFGVGVFSVDAATSRSKGRRRGGPTAAASISLLFFEISADFDMTWGEARHHTLRRSTCCRCSRRSSDKPESWRRSPAAGQRKLLVTLRSSPADRPARAAPARRPRGPAARGAAGLTSTGSAPSNGPATRTGSAVRQRRAA